MKKKELVYSGGRHARRVRRRKGGSSPAVEKDMRRGEGRERNESGGRDEPFGRHGNETTRVYAGRRGVLRRSAVTKKKVGRATRASRLDLSVSTKGGG